jgi:hypothetical protein
MSFLGIFKKKKIDITDSKKKGFLSNDFIERMIRVEQRVSVSLGETKPYNQTNYYKHLLLHEKREFDKYIIKKGNIKNGLLVGFSLLLISIFFLNFEFTGNVVNDAVGNEGFSILSLSIIGTLVGVVALFIVFSFARKFKNRKFQRHFDVLDRIGLSKVAEKYFS